MLSLFPRYKAYFALCFAAAFMLSAALFSDGFLNGKILTALFLLLILCFAVVEILAAAQHQRLLYFLYHDLRPTDFLTLYKPLLQKKGVRANVRFSMALYLCKAHTALGEFEEALAVLDSVPIFSKNKELMSKALLSAARCNLYLFSENIQDASEEYAFLKTLASQMGKPRKALSAIGLERLRIHLAILKGACTLDDADILRDLLRYEGSPLHHLELRYLLGRIYFIVGNLEFSRSYFQEVFDRGQALYIAAQAKCVLEYLAGQEIGGA